MNKESKIYVAGHRGMVGSAIVRELTRQGYTKTNFEELVKLMVRHDMQKVAADHAAEQARVNLAEYLEIGIVK